MHVTKKDKGPVIETKFSRCLTKPRSKQSPIWLNLLSEHLIVVNSVNRAES